MQRLGRRNLNISLTAHAIWRRSGVTQRYDLRYQRSQAHIAFDFHCQRCSIQNFDLGRYKLELWGSRKRNLSRLPANHSKLRQACGEIQERTKTTTNISLESPRCVLDCRNQPQTPLLGEMSRPRGQDLEELAWLPSSNLSRDWGDRQDKLG